MAQEHIKAKQKLCKLLSALTGEEWEVDLHTPNEPLTVAGFSFSCAPGYMKRSDNIKLNIFGKDFASSKGSFNYDDMTSYIVRFRKHYEEQQITKKTQDSIYQTNVDNIKHSIDKFSSFKINNTYSSYVENDATTIVPSFVSSDTYKVIYKYTIKDASSATVLGLLEALAKAGLVKRASDEAAMVARMTQVSPLDVQAEWDKQPQRGATVDLRSDLPQSVTLSVA